MPRRDYGSIEDPAAYDRAVRARIMHNASKTRRRKTEAAIAAEGMPAEFSCWLFGYSPASVESLYVAMSQAYDAYPYSEEAAQAADNAYQRALKAWHGSNPQLPKFLRESISEWGGLTGNQLALAIRIWREHAVKSAEREAQRAAERANAQPWAAGRQQVRVQLASTRWTDGEFPTLKGMWKTEDGRRLWCTVPRGCPEDRGTTVDMKVTVEPSADDATMAFGSRPTLVNVLNKEAV